MAERCTAILLAAGSGTRMGGGVRKQYRLLGGRPLLSYSLETLEKSPVITDIVLVTPEGEQDFCRREIVEPTEAGLCAAPQPVSGKRESAGAAGEAAGQGRAGAQGQRDGQEAPAPQPVSGKVRAVVAGGAERCFSVLHGLRAIAWPCDYCFIHDGARPFLDGATIERLMERVRHGGTAVAGMPVKDTVKLADARGVVEETPDRSRVWLVQTPQTFSYPLITGAYEKMAAQYEALTARGVRITDDAMVVELLTGRSVQLVEASYRNIKVTTQEDLVIAEAFLKA